MIQKTYPDEFRHVHVLSYGGGTQSTALLLMALRGEVNGVIPDYIIFSDTGWEPPHVYEWVDRVNEYIKREFDREIIFANGKSIRQNIVQAAREGSRFASIPYFLKDRETGKKGMLMRHCTKEYKIEPVNKKIRDLLGYKPRQRVKEMVHLWKGISTDEIQRVKPTQVKWQVAEHPLVDILDMDRNECIKWVEDMGLGTPPKSACIGCPYHSDSFWADMKQNQPADFEDACEVDRLMRDMPKVRGAMFMHRSRTPLSEVAFKIDEPEIDEFNNECEGMCGL